MSEQLIAALLERIDSLERKIDHVVARSNEVRQLVGPFAATFPDGSMLTQTIHNLKYFVDPDDLIITPQMVIYRQWEADLSDVFRHLCQPDSVVVDVGANFGYFTVLAANLIGPHSGGQVFSFEPNPKLARLLRKNIEINWSIAPVTFHEAAVAEAPGELVLHIPLNHGANASLSAPPEVECDTHVVPAVRLDDTLPSGLAVDLMKIDVEGHEATVLRGAREVIARSPNLHLVMEWSRKQMQHARIDPSEIVSLLEGFTPHRIELGSPPLAHPESFDWLLGQEYTDTLFVRV